MILSSSSLKWAAILFAASVSFIAFAQSKLPTDLDPQSRARLPYLKSSEVDAKGKRVVDTFGKSGTVSGPLAFATYNPAVGQALLDLHDAAITGGTLDAHTRELAILVACRATNYNLEWNGHEASGLKAGIDAKVIDVVRFSRPLTGLMKKTPRSSASAVSCSTTRKSIPLPSRRWSNCGVSAAPWTWWPP